MDVKNLRCEYIEAPEAINTIYPRLSWELSAVGFDRIQTAYQILVASSPEKLQPGMADLWDSGKRTSSQSVNIQYQGEPLASRQKCFWKVRVWDEEDRTSTWSVMSVWRIGLLNPEDWTASWIGYDAAQDDPAFAEQAWANQTELKTAFRPLPSPYLRRAFELKGAPKEAMVYVSALGLYELYINGQRVGTDLLTPGWVDYTMRVPYQAYDVTNLLQPGGNVVAAILADGWYAGAMANRGQHFYGEDLRLLAQLEVELQDGSQAIIPSDGSWKAHFGAIRQADLLNGEVYDARLEEAGWNTTSFDMSAWAGVEVSDTNIQVLTAHVGSPVRRQGVLEPKHIFKLKNGNYIVDMGQNFSGWAHIKVQGSRGDSVVMRFGEMLNEDSTLHTRNLRSAHCKDVYVLKGGAEEQWEPRFTYRGYRYIEVTSYPGELTKEKIQGVVIHSQMMQAGSFESSSPLLNQLYQNIRWSQRSNFIEVPTDCPQRDERLGWLGDAQLFANTSMYNYDIAAFYSKWMQDLIDAQFENGRMPSTAPRVYRRTAAGWGDAVVIIPWRMFEMYGDTQLLELMYPTMQRWLAYHDSSSDGVLSGLDSYGDWQNVKTETAIPFIASAFFKHSLDLCGRIAGILGKQKDAAAYKKNANEVKQAIAERFIDDSGMLKSNTQTAYLLALGFELIDDALKDQYAAHLVELISANDSTLTTGILGTAHALPVLTEYGHLDLAYSLLEKRDYPSWGYQIDLGATTIWERWDGYTADSGFNSDATNSFNHFAFGSVGEWFYATILGIKPSRPGFEHVNISPQVGGSLTHASGHYHSIRGKVASAWRVANGLYHHEVTVPPNVRATIDLQTSTLSQVTVNGESLEGNSRFEVVEIKGGNARLNVGSGTYVIEVRNFHS